MLAPISSHEAELRIYWDACQNLQRARRRGDEESVRAAMEEVEAIGALAEWTELKRWADWQVTGAMTVRALRVANA